MKDTPTKPTDPELWRTLKVDDRVRLVHMPTKYHGPDSLHPETREAYQRVIDRKRPLRVYKVDEWERPWVKFHLRDNEGRVEHHYMQIDHDGLVLTPSRSE